jgi:hypothetical protein
MMGIRFSDDFDCVTPCRVSIEFGNGSRRRVELGDDASKARLNRWDDPIGNEAEARRRRQLRVSPCRLSFMTGLPVRVKNRAYCECRILIRYCGKKYDDFFRLSIGCLFKL